MTTSGNEAAGAAGQDSPVHGANVVSRQPAAFPFLAVVVNRCFPQARLAPVRPCNAVAAGAVFLNNRILMGRDAETNPFDENTDEWAAYHDGWLKGQKSAVEKQFGAKGGEQPEPPAAA